MSSPALRIGVVGAGHFGRYHTLKVAASDRAVLSGVHDRDSTRADAVAWEAKAKYLPLDDLLAGSDAVVIATPADAALMMYLGAEGVFVGSGIFKSSDPERMAKVEVDAKAAEAWFDALKAGDCKLDPASDATPGIDDYSLPAILYGPNGSTWIQ